VGPVPFIQTDGDLRIAGDLALDQSRALILESRRLRECSVRLVDQAREIRHQQLSDSMERQAILADQLGRWG
jgi:hypothetical protein